MIRRVRSITTSTLVIRDFDKTGFSIVHTLRTDSRRYWFRHQPRVIDLGLRLVDAERLGLQREPVVYHTKVDQRENLRARGATEAECAVLVQRQIGNRWEGEQVELNAIDSSLDQGSTPEEAMVALVEQEGEYDADTHWAIAWFEQYGIDEGPFGTAETLSKAKNTSVGGMVEAGIAAARAGKVRLLKRDELPVDWNPSADRRLTAWETAQHLVRALDQHGEQGAAELLARIPGDLAEIARDLAYRLYTTCERKKWPRRRWPTTAWW
jgi:hypothetical protein